MIGRERQTAIYLGGVSGRRPRVPIDPERLEEAARKAMPADHFAYVKAGAGTEDTVRENRAAFTRRRIVPRMLRGAAQPDATVELFGRTARLAVPARPGRRARARPPRRRRGGRARGARDRRADDLLQPGVAPDGGVRGGAGRLAALVPALLEHLGRARREPRRARRGVRLRGDRADARHHDRGLAPARPRARLPPVPARAGDRAVHERPGVPAPDGGGLGQPRHADAAADPAGAAHARPAHARVSRARSSRTSRAGAAAPRSSASRRSSRGRS